jgi:hypothetical protein
MREVAERLSHMYSIEVQAMPPVPAYFATLCCAELGDLLCSCRTRISAAAATHSKSDSQDEYTLT